MGKTRRGTGMQEINPVARGLLYAFLVAFTCLTIFPLIWLVISSFKTTTEFYTNTLGLPRLWTTINYPGAWRIGNFDTLFLNSLFYTVVSTVAIILFSIAASFAFAKIRSFATPFLHGSFVIGILLTIQSLMVPLFIMAYKTHLLDTRLGVLLPYVGLGLPLGIYLCTEFIKGIPDAVIESARIDGAGYLNILWRIIIPMTRPVITTLAVLSVACIFNEFMLINILVGKEALKSLPVGMMKFSSAMSTDFGKQFAALVIGMIPIVVFYLIFRRQITKGVAAGAVKG